MAETSIVIFERASQMLAEADTIQKVKEFKTLALTAADLARRKGMGERAVQYARSYALEAERKLGELLKETERARGKRTDLVPTVNQVNKPTLSDLGVSKKESARAQLLAELPRERFDKIQRGEKAISTTIKEFKREHLKNPVFPRGKYHVIYADPPWQYQNAGFEESAENKYPTMATSEICKLPITELAGEKAVLFLWSTNAFLEDALRVCREWGFYYKTNLAWIKNAGPSIGWFVISRHELLLIATRGDGVHPKEKIHSWFKADITIHSQKPKIVYDFIEKMYDGPYIELFARQERKGWVSWGNELIENRRNKD